MRSSGRPAQLLPGGPLAEPGEPGLACRSHTCPADGQQGLLGCYCSGEGEEDRTPWGTPAPGLGVPLLGIRREHWAT